MAMQGRRVPGLRRDQPVERGVVLALPGTFSTSRRHEVPAVAAPPFETPVAACAKEAPWHRLQSSGARFGTVRRGLDPKEVDAFAAAVASSISALEDELRAHQVEAPAAEDRSPPADDRLSGFLALAEERRRRDGRRGEGRGSQTVLASRSEKPNA